MAKKTIIFALLMIALVLPVAVFASDWSPSQAIGVGWYWDQFPESVAGEDGTVYVVWGDYPWYRSLWINSYDGESWLGRKDIDGGASNNWNADIALDPQGHPHVAWWGRYSSGLPQTLYTYFDGTNWSPPYETGLMGNYPSIVVDDSGQVFIAASYNHQIEYIRRNGDSWTAVESIGDTSLPPELTVDPTGVTYLAYLDGEVHPTIHKWLGSSWSEEEKLAESCYLGNFPHIQMFHHDSGTADLICLATTILHFHRDSAGNWGTPTVVTTENSDYDGDAGGGTNGIVLVIWSAKPEARMRVWDGSEWSPEEYASDTGYRALWTSITLSSENEAFAFWGGFGEAYGTSTLTTRSRLIEVKIPIAIDIKPDGEPNSINCGNVHQVIPVAILTTDEFDATTVDHTTVTFEGAVESHRSKVSGEPRRHEEDVDLDGDIDLVFHFNYDETNLTCESEKGVLSGETFDGSLIEGIDAINMVPPE